MNKENCRITTNNMYSSLSLTCEHQVPLKGSHCGQNVIPSPTDELGHVICFGQWNMSKCPVGRAFHMLAQFDLASGAPVGALRRICPKSHWSKEDEEDMKQTQPRAPAARSRIAQLGPAKICRLKSMRIKAHY